MDTAGGISTVARRITVLAFSASPPFFVCASKLGFFCVCVFRSSLLTKKQDQAARKIMRFLRRCRHRYDITLWEMPFSTAM